LSKWDFADNLAGQNYIVFLFRIVLGLTFDNVDITVLLALPDGAGNDLTGMLSGNGVNPPIEYM
jgi:hypothetical protein